MKSPLRNTRRLRMPEAPNDVKLRLEPSADSSHGSQFTMK